MIEPLYCTQCGAEDFDCGCELEDQGTGPYCELTGMADCDCEYCAPDPEDEE